MRHRELDALRYDNELLWESLSRSRQHHLLSESFVPSPQHAAASPSAATAIDDQDTRNTQDSSSSNAGSSKIVSPAQFELEMLGMTVDTTTVSIAH